MCHRYRIFFEVKREYYQICEFRMLPKDKIKCYNYLSARKCIERTTADVFKDASVLGDGNGERQSTVKVCLNYAGYASAFKFRLKGH